MSDLISRKAVIEMISAYQQRSGRFTGEYHEGRVDTLSHLKHDIIHCIEIAYDVDVQTEAWKFIQGYEGLYQVSSLGRIKSVARCRKNNGNSQTLMEERLLKQSKNNKGYCRVELCKDGARKPFSVHRLVADAFVINPLNKPEVNHIDEDKSNNKADNLEWCTTKENINHGEHNRKSSITRGYAIQALNDCGDLINEFPSMCEAQRQTGIPQQNISRCIYGKCKQAGGYIWRLNKEGAVKDE